MAACSLPFGASGPTSVSKQISAAQGGSLSISTGATLTIPANALSGDATVTLTDPGKPKHAKDDPLQYASDMFNVSTKGANGGDVPFKTPATLTITPDSSASQNAQDLIVAEVDPDLPGAIKLHQASPAPTSSTASASASSTSQAIQSSAAAALRADDRVAPPLSAAASSEQSLQLTHRAAKTISYPYQVLKSNLWAVAVPILKQQPAEHEVLQVPWYYQGGLPWCVPTSLTEMLRYYDFSPSVGDPLIGTFGGSKALANWQIAGKSGQPAGSGAGYGEMDNIGVPNSWGTGYLLYLWDDDFFVTAQGATGNYTDFKTYVILVNTNLFDLGSRKPLAMIVDNWWHSVVIVGVDGNYIYLHDSNGPIAEKILWDDFQKQAQSWRTDDKGKKYEVHTLWTAVANGYPIRPETQRRGSIVIARNDLSTTDSIGNPLGIEWDGQNPHGHGYYLNDPSNPGLWLGTSDLGYFALRPIPLHYQYRIANVTNVPLTFKSTAELSGPTYGASLVSHTDTTTVPPYSLSGYISGSFSEPVSGSGAIFDVKLFETDKTNVVQDVKFVRYELHDPSNPTVQITLPANGAHVYAGSEVVFTGSSSDPDSGHPLPGGDLSWAINGSGAGTGGSISHTFGSTGSASIALTGTNAAGRSGSASISIVVDPAPPNASVQIVSPANNTYIDVNTSATSAPVNLVGSGSPGMQLSWSSSIDGNLGSGANITPSLTVQNQGNCATPTKHVITLNGHDNLGRNASASITIYLRPVCIR